jgi:hypothetical protein
MPAAAAVPSARSGHAGYVLARGFCLLFYFGQNAFRPAPGVMVPELKTPFGLSALGVSSLIGLYDYAYSTEGIVLAIGLACLLRETGQAVRSATPSVLLAKAR